MMRKTTLLVMMMVSALGCSSANAAPARTKASSAHVTGGREKLGAREVDGKLDRDVLPVGREDGRFRALHVQVDG